MNYEPVISLKEKVYKEPNSYIEVNSDHMDGFKIACKEYNLNLCRINDNLYVIKRDGVVIGGINFMISSLVSSFAIKVASDKTITNNILSSARLKVPRQVFFKPSQIDDALSEWKIGRYSVVKPSNAAGGSGITVGIEKEEEFLRAFDFASKSMAPNGLVILEEEIKGFDLRAVVVCGEFVCAVSRIPPYVKGDGVHTVSELVDKKNIERKKHPHHKKFLISKNFEDVALDFVPKNSEYVFLSDISNIHNGGEAIDVTDYISDDIKNTAVKAVEAIPGLNVAGVDFILKDFNDSKSAFIIELNTSANFGIHYYPFAGVSRNPAEKIILKFLENRSRV